MNLDHEATLAVAIHTAGAFAGVLSSGGLPVVLESFVRYFAIDISSFAAPAVVFTSSALMEKSTKPSPFAIENITLRLDLHHLRLALRRIRRCIAFPRLFFYLHAYSLSCVTPVEIHDLYQSRRGLTTRYQSRRGWPNYVLVRPDVSYLPAVPHRI